MGNLGFLKPPKLPILPNTPIFSNFSILPILFRSPLLAPPCHGIEPQRCVAHDPPQAEEYDVGHNGDASLHYPSEALCHAVAAEGRIGYAQEVGNGVERKGVIENCPHEVAVQQAVQCALATAGGAVETRQQAKRTLGHQHALCGVYHEVERTERQRQHNADANHHPLITQHSHFLDVYPFVEEQNPTAELWSGFAYDR